MSPAEVKAIKALHCIAEKVEAQCYQDNLWYPPKTIQEKILKEALEDLHDVIDRFTITQLDKAPHLEIL